MNLVTILSFTVPWLIGLCIVTLCFRESILEHFFLKLFLGLGAGIGVTSSLYFFWSLVFDPSQRAYFLLEGFLLAGLLFLTVRDQRKRPHQRPAFATKPVWRFILTAFIGLLALVAVIAAVEAFYNLTLVEPHGRYDAWAIWSYRARYIFRAGPYWLEAISPLQFHPDYPLLVPLSISRSWLFIGGEIQKSTILLAALFTFGSIGLLASALNMAKQPAQGLAAACILAASITYIYNGSILFADIPQAFFILAAVITTYLAFIAAGKNPMLVFLAGLSVGYCGWVKNEGVMFMAICLGTTVLVQLIFGRKSGGVFFRPYLAGLALPLLTVLFFKLQLSPANDLINPQNLATVFDKLVDAERYTILFREYRTYFTNFGEWTFSMFLLLIVYAVIAFGKVPRENRKGLYTIAALILLQLVGYTFIYLITPLDLTTHIRQSIRRLIIHVYPAFLFTLFLIVKSPEEIFSPLASLFGKRTPQPEDIVRE